jgi:hypothetical protein
MEIDEALYTTRAMRRLKLNPIPFADVPLVLIGFGRTREGSGIYPALWSAMLAAREPLWSK